MKPGRTGAVRRDWLRRQVEKGKVVVVGSYHFDDMYGTSRMMGETRPAAIAPDDWRDRLDGVFYLRRSEFDGAAGRAYANADGTITLYVHSNSNYTLRVKEEARVPKRERDMFTGETKQEYVDRIIAEQDLAAKLGYEWDPQPTRKETK